MVMERLGNEIIAEFPSSDSSEFDEFCVARGYTDTSRSDLLAS